jgi:uncharacterized protein YndB with AHSA1/START domain
MATLRVIESGSVDAPIDLVYDLISDMRQHHAHFLPPSLKDLRVEEGGQGAGTIYRVTGVFLGGERVLRMRVDEPEPGRVLTESHLGSPLVTTWTIEPAGDGSQVTIETIWPAAGGFGGVLERLLAPRAMAKVYREELRLLDRYARDQAAQATGVMPAAA